MKRIISTFLVLILALTLITPVTQASGAAPNLTPINKGADAVLTAIAKKKGINITDADTARKIAKGFEYKTRGNVIYPNFQGMKKSVTRVPTMPGYLKYTISAAAAAIIADAILGYVSEMATSNMELVTIEYPEYITDSKGRWVATEWFYAEPLNPYQGWPMTDDDMTWKADDHRIHYYNPTTDTWEYKDLSTYFSFVGSFRFTGLGEYFPKEVWHKYGQEVLYEWNSYGYYDRPFRGDVRLPYDAPLVVSGNVLEYDIIPKSAIVIEPATFPEEDFELWIPDPAPGTQDPLEIIINNPEILTNPDPALITQPNTDPVTDYTGEPVPENEPAPSDPPQPEPKPDPDDWSNKMKALVTTKFPFSLPWDIYRVLSLLNADPIRPDIHVNETFMGMPLKIDVTFEYLDPYMPYFRAFIVIGFCMFLITSTRKLLGGST